MARLRMRLIRFGDRDGLGTSEATRTRGGPSVSRSLSPHRHELPGYGIRSDCESVLAEGRGDGLVHSPCRLALFDSITVPIGASQCASNPSVSSTSAERFF